MYQKTIAMGRLGHAPSLKQLPSGDPIVEFSVAVSDKKDSTEWFRAKAFGKNAENIDKFFDKGDMILVEGRLQTRTWEKDGQKKYSTELIVDRWAFCGEKKEKQDREMVQEHPKDDGSIPF